jgi:hypothetical protein
VFYKPVKRVFSRTPALDGLESLIQRMMLRSAPLEQKLVGLNINLLKETVPDIVRIFLPIFKVAKLAQMFGVDFVDSEQCCPFGGDDKIMEIGS